MNKKDLIEKINKYKNEKMENLNIDELNEITNIKIDKRKSSKDRMLDFFNLVNNPYAFSYKGKIIQIGFSESNLSANDCLTNMLSTLYK